MDGNVFSLLRDPRPGVARDPRSRRQWSRPHGRSRIASFPGRPTGNAANKTAATLPNRLRTGSRACKWDSEAVLPCPRFTMRKPHPSHRPSCYVGGRETCRCLLRPRNRLGMRWRIRRRFGWAGLQSACGRETETREIQTKQWSGGDSRRKSRLSSGRLSGVGEDRLVRRTG